LGAYLLPFADIPGDHAKLAERMAADPEFRGHVAKVVARQLDRYEKILVPSRGKTLRDIAQAEKRDVCDIAVELQSHGVVGFSMSEEDVRDAMVRDWVVTGSDGPVAHPRTYGTFTRKIGRYCLRDKLMPLERVIHQSTGKTAEIFQLAGRGILRPGWFADITVFDENRLIDRADFSHPARYSEGIEYVLVNGRFALEKGKPNGALAGRPLT
jgi:N-acyl-D-amino-acid deacylase